ncbi:hypothetical protein PRIPAC_85713 [Pristionchus pacificus]|uniref:Uncharacterized protein n=1 Tax=Pristionchus pacificus TaxID=54126 RepID=A0A2A6BNI1_PRIPA|nr:hypothetical protein PRIPAC_85713 [Pristionchus pacificus]|eukprot:PDM67522.1 hypothetical protein PRIPAC_48939 [Pristionchus pacificus]
MAAAHKRPRLVAEEDLFSQLPRDCHLSIFRLLDSEALDELECVSSQIREIVERRHLIGNKTTGSLSISEGAIACGRLALHEFIFAISKSDIRLCYRIFRGEREGKRTKETVFRTQIMQENSFFKEQYVRSRVNRNTTDGATVVPSAMFDNLHKFAKKHTINNCTLNKIFDEQFLSTFAAKCIGTSPSFELDIFQGLESMRLDTVGTKEIKWFFSLAAEVTNIHLRMIDKTKMPNKRLHGYEIDHPSFEDHLSQLANDCLLDIFTRLDFNDLDEIATLSSKLCSVSALARPKAGKLQATKLIVSQDNRFLRFEMHCDGHRFFLGNSDKLTRRTTPPPKHKISPNQTMAASVRQRASIFYDRFVFTLVEFEKVSIDDHFIEFIQQVTSSICASFCVNDCAFNENSSSQGRQRLMLIIRSVMPVELTLRLKSLPIDQIVENPIDQNFLIECATQSGFPSLTVDIDHSQFLNADRLMDHLWKFRTLDMPKLLLNTDWLIMPLLVSFHRFLSLFHNRSSIFSLFYAKRLLCMKKGCWKFRITRELNEREITAALGRDLKGEGHESKLVGPTTTCLHPAVTTKFKKLSNEDWIVMKSIPCAWMVSAMDSYCLSALLPLLQEYFGTTNAEDGGLKTFSVAHIIALTAMWFIGDFIPKKFAFLSSKVLWILSLDFQAMTASNL